MWISMGLKQQITNIYRLANRSKVKNRYFRTLMYHGVLNSNKDDSGYMWEISFKRFR